METLVALAGVRLSRHPPALTPTFGRPQTKNILNAAFAAETQATGPADFLEAQR